MPVPSPASASVPSLRFPKPQGSQRLANWISSSSPDIMSQPVSGLAVDDDAMAEFEMINTDGETESIGSSVDLVAERLARPDDMVSLASTDNTNDKEDDHQGDDYLGGNDDTDYDRPWLASIDGAAETPSPTHSPSGYMDGQSPGYSWASHATEGPFKTEVSALEIENRSIAAPAASCKPKQQSPAEEPRATKRRPAQLAKAFVDSPGVEPWLGMIRAVVAAFLFGALVHAVLPFPQHSREARHASRATQDRPTPITIVATPATVTVTVTSTSTVRLNNIHELVRKITDTADGAVRTVRTADGTYIPALVSMASKLWNDTAVSIKLAREAASYRLSADGIHHLGRSIGAGAMRVRADTEQRVAHHLKTAEALKDDLNFNVLRAQIQSWLVCLRIRGDMAEYQRYEARAIEHLRIKHHELLAKRAPVDQTRSSTFP
ncbi:hypothetical protein MAPG_08041 [Magnaporthiopsis poae ATCC 64411]|uniref:Uncharacterized protein n=1 Tax=Magnaporthiopsis poae (strain ATCC 64411 / 73-15) TaxID=644358 RepID=A0A0C4E6B0_MAGP6|nr:hypothetical protein MAPG_08041 [Magnaporthiopsis poae ATCC 64411]